MKQSTLERRDGLGHQFPGEIAGASLKRFGRGRSAESPTQFPGEIAGASLKRPTW